MKRPACLLLLIAWGAAAQMQVRVSPSRGHVWVQVTNAGLQRFSLTSSKQLDDSLTQQAVTALFGCPVPGLSASPHSVRAESACATSRPDSLHLQTGFRPVALAELLRKAGIEQVDLTVTPPTLGRVTVAPPLSYSSFSVENLPQSIEIDAGFDTGHLWTLAVGAGVVLLLPVILLLGAPANLIHLLATMQTLFVGGLAVWIWALMRSQAWSLAELYTGSGFAGPIVTAVPPLLGIGFGSWLAARALRRLGRPGDGAARYRFYAGAAAVFPLVTFSSLFSSNASDPHLFTWAFGGLLLSGLCLLLAVRAFRGDGGYNLPAGPLKERIAQLAASAGVPLRGVTVLGSPEPVAFAFRWGVIGISAGLLRRLSRREVDAVVCHELSHIAPGNHLAGGIAYVALAGLAMAAGWVPAAAALLPLVLLGAFFAFKAWRRGEEYRADANAVRWSRDPEALISGLLRVSSANGMPLAWGAPASWVMAHPSTRGRLEAIARLGGVARSRLDELIGEACSVPVDSYAGDLAQPEQPPIWKQLQSKLFAYGLASPLLLGLVGAWIAERVEAGFVATILAGAPLVMLVLLLGYEYLVGGSRAAARRLAVGTHGEGVFAGFGPASEPRIFDGMYHYDTGMVRIRDGALEFAGDRVQFRLTRDSVRRVWVGNGPKHWTPRPVVYLQLENRTFSLQSFEARLWPFTITAARTLCTTIETWRSQAEAALHQSAASLPSLVEGEPDPSISLTAAIRAASVYAAIGGSVHAGLNMFGTANDPSSFLSAPLLCGALSLFVAWPRVRLKQ